MFPATNIKHMDNAKMELYEILVLADMSHDNDNDNDNERHLLPKLYKENQTIIQVHNSTYRTAIDKKYNEIQLWQWGQKWWLMCPKFM